MTINKNYSTAAYSTTYISTQPPQLQEFPGHGDSSTPGYKDYKTIVGVVVTIVFTLVIVSAVIIWLKRKRDGGRSSQLNNARKLRYDNKIPVVSIIKDDDEGNNFNAKYVCDFQCTPVAEYQGSEVSASSYVKRQPAPRRPPRIKLSGSPPLKTVSQYLDTFHLSYESNFIRGAPNRRSSSLGSLPQQPQLPKSSTMASQDSGFSSALSIPCSPVTPTSLKEFLRGLPRKQPDQLIPFIKTQIQDAIRRYYSIPERIPGVCYASKVFSIGEFDERGGVLTLANCDAVKLDIPPGALEGLQLIYFMMYFENNNNNDETGIFSPSFECGVDGLHFKIPVELTFPHSAVDTEVFVASRSGDSALWNNDYSSHGPEISDATCETVTLKIHHFTGFKLTTVPERDGTYLNRTCRSRIPVRVQNPSYRTQRDPGKKLSVSVFKCGEKARVYFINSSSISTLHEMIDERERDLGFSRDSHWKEFTFLCGKGGLTIRAETINRNGQKQLYRKFPFDDRKVLGVTEEYVELISRENSMLLDIIFSQPKERGNYTQLSICLEKSDSRATSLNDSMRQRKSLEQIECWMSTLELTRSSLMVNTGPFHDLRVRPIAMPRQSYTRSVSEVTSTAPSYYPSSRREPQENCDHSNHAGACSCWRETARSPTESEYDPSNESKEHELRRGAANRRSRESGYESSINSPITPLRGPDELTDSMRLNSEFSTGQHLTLETVVLSSHNVGQRDQYIQQTEI